MRAFSSLTIPPMSARAFTLRAGQCLTIADPAGRQPGDLVAFRADDLAVHFSQARTRVEHRRIALGTGDRLWTNTFPPEVMLTIVRSTHGTHDLLYPPCCRYALAMRFGVDRDGCVEHLAQALAPWGIAPAAVPDPLNLFFTVTVDGAGGMAVQPPSSPPGSELVLQAHMDCLLAIATCSVPFAGREPSGYTLTITDPPAP
jgi:uncharacterized protein YcgI (DUF1989 family)